MKRKVLVVASWFPSESSPISGIFVQEQAIVLSRRYDVAVLVPRWIGWRALLKKSGGLTSELTLHAGLPIQRERAFVALPRNRRLAYRSYLQAAQRGFEALLATWGHPDIIHAHVVLPSGWAAVELGSLYSIPCILTEHSGPFSINLRTAYERSLVRKTLAKASQIIAVSPAMEKQIQAFLPTDKIHIVGNVIDTGFFTLINETQENGVDAPIRFLSVAALVEPKGIKYLLEAANILTQRGYSSFELLIGGEGPERLNLEQMATKLGLLSRCRFLGSLTRLEVRDWMRQSDVFVLPSLGETFGIVLGEAMACGKPVIATRCGGPEFVVTPETGLLVNVADSGALADAMEEFIVGKFKYNAHLIRETVLQRFGEKAFLDNISALYQQVLQ